MPETIYLDDRMVTMFSKQDFVDLIREELGRDAGNYLEDAFEDAYQDGYNLGRRHGEDGYGEM